MKKAFLTLLLVLITLLMIASFVSYAESISNEGVFSLENGVLTVFADDDECPWEGDKQEITKAVLTENVTSVGAHWFDGCQCLEEVVLGENCSAVGDYAFANCPNLKRIWFGCKVTSFGEGMTVGSTALQSVVVTDQSIAEFQVYSSLLPYNFESYGDLPTGFDRAEFHQVYVTGKWKGTGTLTALGQKVKELDVNKDGSINVADVTALLDYLSNDGASWAQTFYDLTNEGTTNIADVTRLLDTLSDECGHTVSLHVQVSSTCTKEGKQPYYYCPNCDMELSVPTVIEKKAHTPVTVYGYAATCGSTGLTDGQKCSVCNLTLVEREVIPATGKHTPLIDAATDPTCVLPGYSMGTHCSVCGKIIIAQTETSPALGHTPVTDAAVVATCSKTGLTEGSHCATCQATIVAQKTVAKKPHTPVTDVAVAPKCEETGLTEGSHCSVCNTILIAQTTIPTLGHNYVNRVCTRCGEVKLSEGLKYTLNSDRKSYYVSGIGICTDTDIVIPNTFNGKPVTSIGRYAFNECSGLTCVEIGDSVNSIGDYAFSGCSSLTSVVIGDSVNSIGDYAFSGCSSLTSVVIPDSVTSIGSYAFKGCRSLTSVVIGNSIESIGNYAFNDCRKLVEVINHSSLNITAGSWGYGDVGYYAKEVHTGTSKIVNKDGYLFYTYGGTNYLVGYVGNDTDLVLPANYNGQNYEISIRAFSDCDNLISAVVPDGITILEMDTFAYCPNLQSLVIPASVTKIGQGVVYSSNNLKDVYFTGTSEQWVAISFAAYNDGIIYATIHYNYVPET